MEGMERLTVWFGENAFYANYGNPLIPVEILDTPYVREVLRKLAEYEDTGLSPEIKRVLDEYGTVFVVVEKVKDISERDNQYPQYINDGWAVVEIPPFIGFLKSLKNIGKTVFFSRGEAKRQAQKFTNEKLTHEDIYHNTI